MTRKQVLADVFSDIFCEGLPAARELKVKVKVAPTERRYTADSIRAPPIDMDMDAGGSFFFASSSFFFEDDPTSSSDVVPEYCEDSEQP